MALKSTIAAGLAAAAFAVMPVSQVEAKTKIVIGIGAPDFGYGNSNCSYNPRRCGYWTPRPHYFYTPRHRPIYYYGDDVPVRHKLSCGAARNLVDHSGFNRVRASECRGKVYTFTGSRKGHLYVVKVNSVTGRIIGSNRI